MEEQQDLKAIATELLIKEWQINSVNNTLEDSPQSRLLVFAPRYFVVSNSNTIFDDIKFFNARVEQKSDEWFSFREKVTISASDIPSIYGVSKYGTYFDILSKKVNILKPIYNIRNDSNLASEYGVKMEKKMLECLKDQKYVFGEFTCPFVVKEMLEQTFREMSNMNVDTFYRVVCGKDVSLGATPDLTVTITNKYFGGTDVICVEIKNPFNTKNAGLLTPSYFLQLQAQMIASNSNFGILLVLTNERKVVEDRLYRKYKLFLFSKSTILIRDMLSRTALLADTIDYINECELKVLKKGILKHTLPPTLMDLINNIDTFSKQPDSKTPSTMTTLITDSLYHQMDVYLDYTNFELA